MGWNTMSDLVGLHPPSGDPMELRAAYSCVPSGVVAVCGLMRGEPVGLVAGSFTSVSLDPPLVSVCIQIGSQTWPRLAGLPRLGLSVLAEDQRDTCRTLARKVGDRFAGVGWEAAVGGAVFVQGATAWLECAVHSQLPAGDHSIVLLEILRLRAEPNVVPLVFHASKFPRLTPPGESRAERSR